MKNSIVKGMFAALALLPGPLHGAITIEEGILLADSWPETAAISTGNPAEHKVGAVTNPRHLVSQTITPAADTKLKTLYLTYSTPADSEPESFAVRIQEVSAGAGAEAYEEGPNLLPTDTFNFSLANTDGDTRLLKIEFTEADQINLVAGTTYAIEIVSKGSPASFYRRAAGTYEEGVFYDNRVAYNLPSTRDIALAVVAADPVASQPAPESMKKPERASQ